MRSSRQGAIPSDLAWLIDELDDFAERLRILEAPSGEALSSTVAKLQALVANIQAQLDAWTATRYTNTQIDDKDSAVVAQIDPKIDAKLGGNVTIGGAGTVNGNLQVNGEMRVPNAYGFDITYTRRTAWWGNDGRAGYASSSRTKKTAIRPADEEAMLRILDAEPKAFRYRAEVRRRTSLRINEGRDYVPPVEIGLIAEDLEDLGLGWLVYHGENGEVEGIEYSMATVALLAVARDHERRLQAIEADRG